VLEAGLVELEPGELAVVAEPVAEVEGRAAPS